MDKPITEMTRQQIEQLCHDVLEAIPRLRETGLEPDAFVTMVLDQAGAALADIHREIEKAKGAIGPGVVIAFAMQGAIAAQLDELPPEDARSQAYRAGRLVGRFRVDRVAETIARAQSNPQ